MNQANVNAETLISMIIHLVIGINQNASGAKTETIRLIIKLLDKFDFDQDTMARFIAIKGLKTEVVNYLLSVSSNLESLTLLGRAIKKDSSLGQFLWASQSFKKSLKTFFKSNSEYIPQAISQLIARIIELREQVDTTKIVLTAPILPLSKQGTRESINSINEGLVVAQGIPANEVAQLTNVVAEVVNSTRSLDSTNYQFTLAFLGGVITALCFGGYLLWNYSNNEEDLAQNPRMTF